ncbi:MAG: hypothetical protein ACXVHN_01605 [Methanobacterium sp.]
MAIKKLKFISMLIITIFLISNFSIIFAAASPQSPNNTTSSNTTEIRPTNNTTNVAGNGPLNPVIAIIVATMVRFNTINPEKLNLVDESLLNNPFGQESNAQAYMDTHWYDDQIVNVLTYILSALIPFLP